MDTRLEKCKDDPLQAKPSEVGKTYGTEAKGHKERTNRYHDIEQRFQPKEHNNKSHAEKRHEDRANTKAPIQPAVPENFSATRTNPTLNVLPGSDPSLFGTERDTLHCAFYLKTGACRFGPSCSKAHPYPISSPVILLRNFYEPLYGALKREVQLDEDEDEDLEVDETEAYNHFQEFYADTVPELRQFGEILQLKVCRNHAPHLCGNVYVQYKNDEDALRAIRSLNGRFYAGRAISTELSPVTNWKTAICGLFDKQQCPRGRQCNFLHVFRNPNGEYDLRENERRGEERLERTHRHSDREHHHSDREHHHSDREHHHSDREHHHSDREHHHSDREHHHSQRVREYHHHHHHRAHEHGERERSRHSHAESHRQHRSYEEQQHHHRKREREYEDHEHGERKKHKR